VITDAYVRERRLAAGLTLRDLAAGLGITVVEYGKIERGLQSFTPEQVEQLVEIIPGFDPIAGNHAAQT
jgi:transcriptional regulator with XRE-family HTH domain